SNAGECAADLHLTLVEESGRWRPAALLCLEPERAFSSKETQLSLTIHLYLDSVGRSSLGERHCPLIGPPHRADADLQRQGKAILGLPSEALNSGNAPSKHVLVHQQGEDPRTVRLDRLRPLNLHGLEVRPAARRSARVQWTRARCSR